MVCQIQRQYEEQGLREEGMRERQGSQPAPIKAAEEGRLRLLKVQREEAVKRLRKPPSRPGRQRRWQGIPHPEDHRVPAEKRIQDEEEKQGFS